LAKVVATSIQRGEGTCAQGGRYASVLKVFQTQEKILAGGPIGTFGGFHEMVLSWILARLSRGEMLGKKPAPPKSQWHDKNLNLNGR
jgi:hypothetical protein